MLAGDQLAYILMRIDAPVWHAYAELLSQSRCSADLMFMHDSCSSSLAFNYTLCQCQLNKTARQGCQLFIVTGK
jgi:hypothetical protein